MKIKVQIIIEEQDQIITEDVICLERQDLVAEAVGLSVMESKLITAGIQQSMVQHQVDSYIAAQQNCSCCGKKMAVKGHHFIKYRTLFGKLCLKSPRFYTCNCVSPKSSSFSPLAAMLAERAAPELRYLESKWASLMSYGMTTQLLEEVFPLKVASASVEYSAHRTAERLEQELPEEKYSFIEGCPYQWRELPNPGIPIVTALDGGYIHAREGKNRKVGWFEAIVGKSLQQDKDTKRFGYVVDFDKKPKRRLYEMLKTQGFHMNQAVTFLTDGGDTVKDLPSCLGINSEHILDWFHITMKITVMQQTAKSLPVYEKERIKKEIDGAKWYLWHGNVHKALEKLDSLNFELEAHYCEQKGHSGYKLWKAVDEFHTYIESNSQIIPNYGERYRHKEAISSAFVESTVNELISKRMAKKQQMRWTKKGAHLLLQLRVKTLNNELKPAFCRWYPQMNGGYNQITQAAA